MLQPDDIEAIARRVADLLGDAPAHRPQYLDTAAVARMLNASEEWVREHAAELGAVRLGDSPRGPLRFDPAQVTDAIESRRLARSRATTQRRPGPPRSHARVKLLPLPRS
jgi:hypothetical protein